VRLVRPVGPYRGRSAYRFVSPEAALAVLPGGSKRVLVLKAKDLQKARQAIDLIPSPGVLTYRGVRLRDVGGGELAGIERGFVLAGDASAVHAAVDAAAGAGSLASDKTYSELRRGLPHKRLVTGYLSQGWISSHLGGPARLLSAAAHVPSRARLGGHNTLGVDAGKNHGDRPATSGRGAPPPLGRISAGGDDQFDMFFRQVPGQPTAGLFRRRVVDIRLDIAGTQSFKNRSLGLFR